jgi:hypothetical protein
MKRAYRWLAVKPQDRETPQLVRERVKCGKPSCRCTRGVRHGPYWYFPYMNIRRACAGAALGQTCSRGELAHEILPERTTAMPARAPANWRTGPSELTTALRLRLTTRLTAIAPGKRLFRGPFVHAQPTEMQRDWRGVLRRNFRAIASGGVAAARMAMAAA